MTKPRWKDVERAMSGDAPEKEMRPADEFWADFSARAALRRQEAPAPEAAAHRVFGGYRLAMAAAALVALLAGVVLVRPGGAAEGPGTSIRSVEVVASHSAVLIMKDEPSEGAVLWVADMKLDGTKGTTWN